MLRRHPTSTLFPYTTLFRSVRLRAAGLARVVERGRLERHEIRRLERHPVGRERMLDRLVLADRPDRKSTRLNSSHSQISYAVFCLKKKRGIDTITTMAIMSC